MLGVKFEWNANAVADVRKLILTPFKIHGKTEELSEGQSESRSVTSDSL